MGKRDRQIAHDMRFDLLVGRVSGVSRCRGLGVVAVSEVRRGRRLRGRGEERFLTAERTEEVAARERRQVSRCEFGPTGVESAVWGSGGGDRNPEAGWPRPSVSV